MKVVVTGGAGFIGSHVVDRLIERGTEVLVVDDLSSGFKENIPSGAEFVEASFASEEGIKKIVSFAPNAIVHTAAQISVRKSMEDPSYDADVNVKGILQLLTALGDSKPHFVFLSTGGAMYGDTDDIPTKEDHEPLPESLYGLHKRFGELYFDFWNRIFGFQYTALRLGNVYGPRQNPHGEAGVVAIFSERLLNGEECKIFGNGKQTRDFVYVGDVVQAVSLSLDKVESGSPYVGILNIGTGVEVSVNELFQEMKQAADSSSEVEYADGRPGEQLRSVLDGTSAKEILGWEPKETLASGVARTVEWFRNRMKS